MQTAALAWQWKSLSHQFMTASSAEWKFKPAQFTVLGSTVKKWPPHHPPPTLPRKASTSSGLDCSASRLIIEGHDCTGVNDTPAVGRWPHPSPQLTHLEGMGGEGRWFHWLSHRSVVLPKQQKPSHSIINARHCSRSRHFLTPAHLSAGRVPTRQPIANTTQHSLLPRITPRTCTSASLDRLCARRCDQSLYPRSQSLWCRMKSLHLRVEWTKTRGQGGSHTEKWSFRCQTMQVFILKRYRRLLENLIAFASACLPVSNTCKG